ncbi:hypothetical protein OAU50_02230 [Planctomycetota bacterium]|nr:hypothetical protein [Planctomycetota bacterium]
MSEPENNLSNQELQDEETETAELGSLHRLQNNGDENEPDSAEDTSPESDSENSNPPVDDSEDDTPEQPAGGASGGFPAYLRGFVNSNALTRAEVESIDHRTADIEITGESGKSETIPLAHLAPDCIKQIRRRVGAGHVCGAIIDDQQVQNFALEIPEDPNAPAPEPEDENTRLERRLASIEDYIGNGGGAAPTTPQTPAEIMEYHADQQTRIAAANKRLAKLSERPAPVAAVIDDSDDEPEGMGGLIGQIVSPLVEKATTVAVQEAMKLLPGLGGMAGAAGTTIDTEAVSAGGE